MAEAFLRHVGAGRFEAFSAGTNPIGLNGDAVRAMREIGIDISSQESKPIKPFLGQPFQYVITVCQPTKENCPIFPGVIQRLQWTFDDPADAVGSDAERMAVFRRVRDEIADRVRDFVQRAS
jgi:arsenate reductase